MRVAEELRAHEAAGSLAEELPYWGWLDDGRTCLTRSGELIAAGRLRPAAVDGRTPEQVDRVLGLWQRLLSGLTPGAPLYFHLLRRPAAMAGSADANVSDIAAVSKRKRSAFLTRRVQRLDAYVVWSHGAGLRPVAKAARSGPLARLARLQKRRKKGAPTYLASEIEAAAGRFRAMVEAGRSLVAEHTPVEMLGAVEASRLLSELINRPGMAWDGATGSGMNWRLALSELEAERSHLRLDGEPVILYSLLSPPGQAHANLLRDLYCLDATMTVSLEWRPWTVEAARRRIGALSGLSLATGSASGSQRMSSFPPPAHTDDTKGLSHAIPHPHTRPSRPVPGARKPCSRQRAVRLRELDPARPDDREPDHADLEPGQPDPVDGPPALRARGPARPHGARRTRRDRRDAGAVLPARRRARGARA